LAYADEAGFSPIHPNRSAWSPVGKRHLIDAKRGKQLNVMAALLSTGEVFSAKYWEKTTAEIFGGFLGLLTEHVGKPIKLIIDNASIHTAKALRPIIDHLRGKGLTLYFLPPYSPELNRIERLWHKIKHTWMTPKYRDKVTLEQDIEEIFNNFGSKFRFQF
jgi:transposase